MPKYYVTIESTVTYGVTVEADDEESASDLALEMWGNSPDPDRDFHGNNLGGEVTDVEDITDQEAEARA